MSQKREISSPLRTVLTWDADTTHNVVKFIDSHYGPLIKYQNIFRGLEISCHGIPWLIGTATMMFLINITLIRHLCLNLFLALLVDLSIVAVVKAYTRRRRPMANPNDMFATYAMDKFSFPSGHSTRAVMLALLLPYKYNLIFPVPLLFLVWSGSVCASRVLMKRHHFLDVVGGVLIGWLEALFISYVTWLPPSSADAVLRLLT